MCPAVIPGGNCRYQHHQRSLRIVFKVSIALCQFNLHVVISELTSEEVKHDMRSVEFGKLNSFIERVSFLHAFYSGLLFIAVYKSMQNCETTQSIQCILFQLLSLQNHKPTAI